MTDTPPMTPQEISTDGAACRLYRHAPAWDGRRTASVGQFRCEDPASGARLLVHAEEVLGAQGFQAILGPMDGDTWHSYRLATETDGSPPFLLEPVGGPHDRAAFEAGGFAPVALYASARAAIEDAVGEGDPVQIDGVMVEAWDGEAPDRLLGDLFEISTDRFRGNPFFHPISREAFLALYEPVLPAVDPRLVFTARDEDGLAGFLFGLPNWPEGERPRTVIVKTYASRRPGVGRLLLDTAHRRARDLGYASVIHALMHAENASLDRSRRAGARVFRRYALMGKRL